MSEIMYAIVHKDRHGFFTWYREPENFEVAENAKVVGIIRGDLENIVKIAENFERIYNKILIKLWPKDKAYMLN